MTGGAVPGAEAPPDPVPPVRVVAAPPEGAPHRVPRLVSSVDVTVERTVARWAELGLGPSGTDWSRVLVGALQHGVEGLCLDALRARGWHELAPPSVLHTLERRALLAEARFLAHYRALQELRDRDEELVDSLVLLNGMALVGEYGATGHRMVGDADLVVDAGHADRLAARTRELGYWEKEGQAGPTYFKDVEAGTPGAGYVGLHVHAGPPALRPGTAGAGAAGAAGARHWAENLVPHVVGDVKVLRPGPTLELVHLLVRLFDHGASWARWAVEDDVRLVRVLDVELVAATLDGEAAGVLAHARALGATAELAVGLAVAQAVRGDLPAGLAALGPYAAAAAPCTGLLALPAGRVLHVDEPLADRVWCVDKSARARALVGDESPRDWAGRWRHPGSGDEAGLAGVAARAAGLLQAAGLATP